MSAVLNLLQIILEYIRACLRIFCFVYLTKLEQKRCTKKDICKKSYRIGWLYIEITLV